MGALIRASDLYADRVARRPKRFSIDAMVRTRAHGLPHDAPAAALAAGTETTFRRNLRDLAAFVGLRGGKVVLVTMPYDAARGVRDDGSQMLWAAATDEHNGIVREVAREHDALLVDLAAAFEAGIGIDGPVFVDQVHMTAPAMEVKAQRIAEALLASRWLGP